MCLSVELRVLAAEKVRLAYKISEQEGRKEYKRALVLELARAPSGGTMQAANVTCFDKKRKHSL